MMKKIITIVLLFVLVKTSAAQNVGVGTNTPTQKLDVAGNLRVSGAIMPGGVAGNAGQALISNGAGNAPTWENLFAIGGSKFLVTLNDNSNTTGRQGYSTTSGANGQNDSIDIVTTRYNIGTDFTINSAGFINNTIQVNTTGLYHLEGFIRCTIGNTVSGLTPTASINLKYDEPPAGGGIISMPLVDRVVLPQTGTAGSFNYNAGIRFSIDIYFTAGTTFTLDAAFGSLTNYPFTFISAGNGTNSYFSGYRISD
jgi:hypothetical protein